jgi:hypothetical protein
MIPPKGREMGDVNEDINKTGPIVRPRHSCLSCLCCNV